MNEKLAAFQRTHTLDHVPMSPGANSISCKWIYKIKTKFDDSVEWYKARLVARGFIQEYDIDHEEIFAPVIKMTSIRTLIALAAARRWPLYKMDIKNAFLNGDLFEIVYMQPPPGVSALHGHVCRLRRVSLWSKTGAPRLIWALSTVFPICWLHTKYG